MYRHVLVPVDCTDDARREATRVARYLAPMHGTRVTIAASVTPTDNPVLQLKKVRHAEDALSAIAKILNQNGIYARRRLVEGADAIQAFAEEARSYNDQYDLFVLGVHHTRPEIDEAPCQGSFADRLAQRSPVPVMVLAGDI